MASGGKPEATQPLHPSMVDKLDPAYVELYNEHMAKMRLATGPPDMDNMRSMYSSTYNIAAAPGPDVGRIYDDVVILEDGTKLPVRVYEPDFKGPWPVHLNLHGGGYVLGDLDTDKNICRAYCDRAKVVVIDLAYRLAPENSFPKSIHDGFGALKYIHKHGADRFGVKIDSISAGGTSAGGAMALAMAHLARDASIPLRLVIAGVPVIDDHSRYESASSCPWPSMTENQYAPMIDWTAISGFLRMAWGVSPTCTVEELQAARGRAGWFGCLFDAPDFRGLARTLISTASACPFRDEGEKYAQVLIENGVSVTQRRYPGVPHTFTHMDGRLRQAREFMDQTAREIRLAHWDA